MVRRRFVERVLELCVVELGVVVECLVELSLLELCLLVQRVMELRVMELGELVERLLGERLRAGIARRYSHSIVAGGFDERSSATRFTPGTSLMIRALIAASRSYGRRAQSAVIASSEVTARITIG